MADARGGIRFNPFKRWKNGGLYIPSEVLLYPGLGYPAKILYATLLTFLSSRYNPDLGIWPNFKKIGERCGMSKSQISDHMKALVKEGFIEVEEIGNDYHYFFVWHPIFGEIPEDLKPKEDIPKPETGAVDDQPKVEAGLDVGCSENPTGGVRKSEQGCSENPTGCSENPTGCSENPTPYNKEFEFHHEFHHEFPSSPEGSNSSEGNTKSREQLERMSEVALLETLEPSAGANFCSVRYGNWLKAFKKADIKLLLIQAILECRTIDWINEELEARREQKKQQQGVKKHESSGTSRGSSSYGM